MYNELVNHCKPQCSVGDRGLQPCTGKSAVWEQCVTHHACACVSTEQPFTKQAALECTGTAVVLQSCPILNKVTVLRPTQLPIFNGWLVR